ncbi:MAG: phosphatidate cytidylyltransferase [Thermoguttaceae bacterium]|nr:phosphatidate cytidylyltransferase [Thermoguttaceae bacterium]MBQ6617199.1 phosphatidate cytidylyltransferase [Thermoguttaceae bacterium]
MLRWRLLLGTVIIGLVCLLGWFDWYFEKRFGIVGIGLLPLLIGLLIPSCAELITLSRLAGARPQRLLVYLCTLLVVIMSWLAPIASGWAERALTQVSRPRMEFLMHATSGSWAFAALGISLILVFMTEIYRFKRPGVSLIHVAATMFTIVYLGLLSVFLIQIRLVGGIGYLVTFLLTVKMGDTGAYTIGRLFGRTKMAPALSPGKTIEGAVGALFFSCFTSWLMFCQILPNWSTTFRSRGVQGLTTGIPFDWLIFGILIGFIGMMGDLAESMLKRDAQRKDSSVWMPGFGGILDILDSILLAAPVAYALWAFGIVVP